MSEQYEINVHEADVALKDESLVSEWKHLLSALPHPNAIYASPSWVAHLNTTRDSPTRVWSVRGESGRLVGVVPILIGTYVLQFAVKNSVLVRKRLRTVHILGSVPILPQSRHAFHCVVDRILEECPQCSSLYADALPTDTYLWRLLQDSVYPPLNLYVHIVDGPRPWHLLQLDESFEAYLKSMSAKARANIRRTSRQLSKAADGNVNLRRVTTIDDVPEFLEGAVKVSRRSWQHKVLGERVRADESGRRSLEDLASRGVLRCYLLECRGAPCAFVIGYQYCGVYQYAEIGFDEDFAEYSPGTVLLFHIIEDLHEHNPPTTFNFGVGDSTYKRRFGNCRRSDVSCLIMRKNAVNWFLASSHSLFTRSIKVAKKLVGRRVTK